MIQPARVAPPLVPAAPDGGDHVRRDARGGGGQPVPVVAQVDSFRKLVPLVTFPFKHDVTPGKSNGELFSNPNTQTEPHSQSSVPCFSRLALGG
jgi:hypothetical protein